MNYRNLLQHGFIPALTKLRDGMAHTLKPTQTLHTPSGAQTVTQILQTLDGYLALRQAANNAEVQWKMALKKLEEATPAVHSLQMSLKSGLQALHGHASADLEFYGMKPLKRAKLPSPKAVLAAAKRNLSREQLGTLGPKQKKKQIKAAEGLEITIDGQGMTVKKKGQ